MYRTCIASEKKVEISIAFYRKAVQIVKRKTQFSAFLLNEKHVSKNVHYP